MAGTLANGGTCPITGERVFRSEAVGNVLSLMSSCGMSIYSGQFAFNVKIHSFYDISFFCCMVFVTLYFPDGNSCNLQRRWWNDAGYPGCGRHLNLLTEAGLAQ